MASPMTYSVKFFLLIALALLPSLAAADSGTTEDEKCITCHESKYNEALNNIYVHSPFLGKKCVTCHIEDHSSPLSNSRQSTRHDNKPKITWLQKHYEPARTHFFLIPSAKVDDTLFVQTAGNDLQPKVTSISLPPLQQLPQLANDGQPPKIFDIKFLGVKRGILYTATISWKTDEPSDAQIHYGVGTFTQKTRLDPQLKSIHTIDISPVIPGKTYNYTLISKDMHGNRMISQPLTFSTEKVDPMVLSRNTTLSRHPSSPEDLSHQLLAVEDQYFITITANWPTYINIGRHRELRPQITLPANDLPAVNEKQAVPVKHVIMRSSYDTNITSCLHCHKDYQASSSHPINVLPKPGMIFPDDYPVLDDGKMHCMTCHATHASNNEARIRRPTKQELCIGCHKNYD